MGSVLKDGIFQLKNSYGFLQSSLQRPPGSFMLVEEDPFSVPKKVHFWEKNIPKGVVREGPLEGCILLEEECLFPLPITAFCGIPPFPGLRFTKGKESWWVFSTLLDRSDSSVVERLSYKQLVGGSNPSPVIFAALSWENNP